MPKYMVEFRRSILTNVKPDIIQAEQHKVGELMKENIVETVFMSKKMDHIWMTMKVKKPEDLILIIKELPMCRELYFEITHLMD